MLSRRALILYLACGLTPRRGEKHTRVRAGIVMIWGSRAVRFIIPASAVRFNLIARTSVRSINILIYGAPSPPGVLAQVERRRGTRSVRRYAPFWPDLST